MNHLSRKKKLYGAGKKPKVKPAVLQPPKIGNFQFGASFSYIETLDLISDGPIEGLVDNKGNLLYETEQSRGVYLDGTPISIATKQYDDPDSESSSSDDKKVSKAISTFQNLNINDKGGASIFDYAQGGIGKEEGRVTTIMGIVGRPVRVSFEPLVENIKPFLRGGNRKIGGGGASINGVIFTKDPPLINEPRPGKNGWMYYNEYGFSSVFGESFDYKHRETPADGRNEFSFPASNLYFEERYEILFTNNTTMANSDLFVAFIRDNGGAGSRRLTSSFSPEYNESFTGAADFIFAEKFADVSFADGVSGASFFDKILKAWNSFGPPPQADEDFLLDEDNKVRKERNPFMRDLIKHKMDKVFGSYVWEKSTAQELYEEFFHRTWRSGYMVCYFPDRNVLNNIGAIQFTRPEEVTVALIQGNGLYSPAFKNENYLDLLIPICDKDGNLDQSADILGGSFVFVNTEWFAWNGKHSDEFKTTRMDIRSLIRDLQSIRELGVTQIKDIDPFNSKYNYNNVLIESRIGTEVQEPFRYFNKVHIDKSINKNVYGPFRSVGQVQRIKRNDDETKDNLKMETAGYDGPDGHITLENGLPINEGSNDNKRAIRAKDYSSWNSSNNSYFLDEEANPITYYINNPNVSEVFVTLQIDSLFDTVEVQYGGADNDFKAGDKLPTIMNVEIEVGKVLSDASLQPTLTKTYRIAALIEGTTLLDIGNPSNLDEPEKFKHVRDFENLNGSADLSTPFPLPRLNDYSANSSYASSEKRYVKVSKLSAETFSVLISKELTFAKVTEIIPVNLTYPFSAIIGTKIDSKSFSSTPVRSFDARLKLIRIPSNYFPTKRLGRKQDKRYYENKSEFQNTSEEEKSIYEGDWDGSFKIGWTDNPAWILYDLLTNTRYGLGRYLDENDINKWELYKVGRFCDAVDSNGNFEGVPDGRGGLEPRYSCNIMFKSDEKVFDSIQLISKLFRGQTFFRASEVSFVDERVKSPVAIFNNNNVKDGVFSYSNLRRDQQFNTVEVSYLDRFENFTPKVEVIEDEEDIRSRGIFKNRVDGLGVTSRAMARRIGQHLIYKTIKENQRVVFTSGLEALLCQPGDLILIDDDLKNEKSNFGKVLSVDVDNQYIQLSGPYSPATMTGILTVYNPTGELSITGLNDIAETKRSRTDTFTITGSPAADFNIYTGLYNFSGYTDGYTDSNIEDLDKSSEYALYTGTGDNMLYFGTSYTGWTFATGLQELNRDFVAKSTGVQSLDQLNTGFVSNYVSAGDKRGGTDLDISGLLSGDLNSLNIRGILESEITQNSQPHILTLNVATSGVVDTGDGFSFVSGVDKPDFLKFIKLGSPYRFDLKDADDILYKIDSIRENNPNEYLVSAAKFDTGKFSLIEDNISLDKKENTYDYNVATTIGDITYSGLKAPENLSITTGSGSLGGGDFFISGDWDAVTDVTSYEAVLSFPNGGSVSTSVSSESVKFDDLNSIGNYALSVKAIGSSIGTTKTIDSEFSTIRTFILYQALEAFDRSFITNVTFS
jgi:hypothetical protein